LPRLAAITALAGRLVAIGEAACNAHSWRDRDGHPLLDRRPPGSGEGTLRPSALRQAG
jgi:hypothetical protein